MYYAKPGKKPKSAKINNITVRIHDIKKPKDKKCRWCDIETGKECFRHCEDPEIKFLVGGGIMGGKIPDQLSVWGCYKCDLKMSKRPTDCSRKNYLKWQNKWKLGIIKTWLV